MDVNFRMLTGITVIWMLQAEIPVCVFGVGLPVFLHFLKIGSFKKKRNHKHTSNVVLWMACKCFRCSRQKQTKNLVNKDQHLRIKCFRGTLQNLMAKEQRCMTHECFCHVSLNIILRKPLNIAVIFSVCLYVSPVLHNKSDPLPL